MLFRILMQTWMMMKMIQMNYLHLIWENGNENKDNQNTTLMN